MNMGRIPAGKIKEPLAGRVCWPTCSCAKTCLRTAAKKRHVVQIGIWRRDRSLSAFQKKEAGVPGPDATVQLREGAPSLKNKAFARSTGQDVHGQAFASSVFSPSRVGFSGSVNEIRFDAACIIETLQTCSIFLALAASCVFYW